MTFRLDFNPELVHTVPTDELPEGWDARPPTRASQEVGDAWLDVGPSPILRVPSVVVPGEFNLVIAPDHPDFPSIRVSPPEPTGFDPRL